MNETNRELDAVAVVFGLLFLAIAGMWAVSRVVDVSWNVASWLVPLVLLGIGAVGLLTVLRRGGTGEIDSETDGEE
jgi:hypothetical protein